MSREPPVAVVIPSWNSRGLLPLCLASIQDQDVEVELLVVDNGSLDGSPEYLREQGVPHVLLPENVGFAAAINLGVGRTGAPLVFVLNVDTVLEPGCIGRLLEAIESDPELGGVQPRLLQSEEPAPTPDAARIYSAGQALTRDGRAFEEGAGEAQGPPGRFPRREVFGVCGAACLLRRQLFSELGGYDERYFAFYEDVDLNVRARIAGWHFEYEPEAVVWHLGNASWQAGFENPQADNARLVGRNRLATQIKFMPAASIPRIAAVEAGALLRAARRRRFLATLQGKLSAFGWGRQLLRERRDLRRNGDLSRVRRWLGA